MSQFAQIIAARIADADYHEAVRVASLAARVARREAARREAVRLEFVAAKEAFLEARARIHVFARIAAEARAARAARVDASRVDASRVAASREFAREFTEAKAAFHKARARYEAAPLPNAE